MKVRQVTAYRCPDCGQWCDTRWDAMEHCKDYITSGQAWACGDSCDDGLHDTEEQATKCLVRSTDCTDCGHLKKWHFLVANQAQTLCHEGTCSCREYVFEPVLA